MSRPTVSLALAPTLALAVTLVLAACSGGDDETRGESSATQATGVTSVTVSATATATATEGSMSEGSTTDGGGTESGTSDTSGVSVSESDSTAGTSSTTDDSTTSTTTTTTTTTTTDPTTTTTTTTTTDGTTDPSTGGEECKTVLQATIRDFSSSHPDFEAYTGDGAYTGLVKFDLGPDKKPVYANPGPTPQTTGPNEYAQWYNDVPGVNQPFMIDIPLMEVQPGIYTYSNSAFFPIDNQGFGNEGNGHNFHFTTEIHATFTYQGGEVFTFTGDDDLWTFINGKLAIDLGGLHPSLNKSVDLDQMAGTLGITPGGTYAMDIFHAERHTDQSNFRIDTSIQCFIPQ